MRIIRRFLIVALLGAVILTGSAHGVPGDQDNDGVGDSVDNCPAVANPNQANSNATPAGDACEDSDSDGLTDEYERTHTYRNGAKTDPARRDTDGDGVSDGQEVNETFGGGRKTDPTVRDTDGDGWEDGTERIVGTDPTNVDSDGDRYWDTLDNCPKTANPDQRDSDGDGKGDACDPPPDPCTLGDAQSRATCAQRQAGETLDKVDDNVGPVVDTVNARAKDVIDQINGLVDTRSPADLNRMGADGYVLLVSQTGPARFEVTVAQPNSRQPLALNLPALDTYSANGPVGVFRYETGKAPTQSPRLNVTWRYSATRKVLTVKVSLAKNERYDNTAVVFSVPPVGYPQSCGAPVPPLQTRCDGNTVGFYNTAKNLASADALDAVPYPTTVAKS